MSWRVKIILQGTLNEKPFSRELHGIQVMIMKAVCHKHNSALLQYNYCTKQTIAHKTNNSAQTQ